ncbi:hypothetical protein [Actinoallomurus sp. NPDC052274]
MRCHSGVASPPWKGT